MSLTVAITQLTHGRSLALPAYASAGAAGLDLPAAIPLNEPLMVLAGQRVLVPTGFALAIPPSIEGQVRPRSGLALKHGITVLNSPGTIDSDYRGEIKVLLINLGTVDFVIKRGMRIAQLVLAPVVQVNLQLVDELSAAKRGDHGFGSTGMAPITTNTSDHKE